MAAKPRSRWSGEVTEHSDALDLQKDVFKLKDPEAIARSLKHPRKPVTGAKATRTGLQCRC
jgi:hypothetical protein